MNKLFKKTKNLFVFVLMTIMLTACVTGNPSTNRKTYVVNYYTESENLYISYRVGENKQIKMPKAPVKEGMEFLYWETIEGEKITEDTIVTSNLDVYAKWNDKTKELRFVKIMQKYQTYQYKINSDSAVYRFDGKTYEKNTDGVLELLTNINDENYYFGDVNTEDYYFISSSDSSYLEKYNSFKMLDLTKLSLDSFSYDEASDVFMLLTENEKLNEAFKGGLDANLSAIKIKIDLANDKIDSIQLVGTTTVEIKMISDKIDEIKVPSLTKPLKEIKVGEMLTAPLESSVQIRGYLIGSIGNLGYLTDNENIVMATLATDVMKNAKMGDIFDIKGITRLVDGAVVLEDVTVIKKIDAKTHGQAPTILDINSVDDVVKNELVNIVSLLVEQLPTNLSSDTISVTTILNGVTLSLEINQTLYKGNTSYINLLKNLKKGDKLSVENVILDIENKRLIVTSFSNVSKTNIEKTTSLETIYDVAKRMNEYEGTVYGLPHGMDASTSGGKALVIPVAFSDKAAPKGMKAKLEKAFFGTGEDTGWESLTSYYYKSSYGKFTISGTVLDPYNTGKKMSYYEEMYENDGDPDYEIIKAALTYYDSKIDYSEYDSDNDGYIDAIYLVYTAPVSFGYTESESELWWAYTYEYYTEDYEYYDGVEASTFCFIGYDFFDEAFIYGETEEDDIYININTTTLIHETGHVLGLDDYYDNDTSTGPAGGLGGCDMMDLNVGDHSSYSKIILGWVAPYVVDKESTTITLGAFNKTGDCVVIPYKWNGSIFTEFLVLDFYTPDGLNEAQKGQNGLFNTSGIRVYHVDATLKNPKDAMAIYDMTLYNNATSKHKLITIYEADGGNDICDTSTSKYGNYTTDDDIFTVGSILKNGKWYDGTKMGFIVSIDEITSSSATITITFE